MPAGIVETGKQAWRCCQSVTGFTVEDSRASMEAAVGRGGDTRGASLLELGFSFGHSCACVWSLSARKRDAMCTPPNWCTAQILCCCCLPDYAVEVEEAQVLRLLFIRPLIVELVDITAGHEYFICLGSACSS